MSAPEAMHRLALSDTGAVLSFPPGSSTALIRPGAADLLARVGGPGRAALLLPDAVAPLHGGLRVGAQIAAALPGARRAALDRATDLLEQAGVSDPHASVGLRPHRLSALDRQRAQLALALALEPGLLLADDPAAGLDPAASAAFAASLTRLQERLGFTLVVAAEAPETVVRLVREILVLDGDRVRERRRRRAADQSSSSSA